MYLVAIAWMYVVLMMSVAEATNANGTVLGAIVTFFLYGLLPLALVVYLMQTPSRRKAIKAREAAEWETARAANSELSGTPEALATEVSTVSHAPNAGSHAPAAAQNASIPPVRKEA